MGGFQGTKEEYLAAQAEIGRDSVLALLRLTTKITSKISVDLAKEQAAVRLGHEQVPEGG